VIPPGGGPMQTSAVANAAEQVGGCGQVAANKGRIETSTGVAIRFGSSFVLLRAEGQGFEPWSGSLLKRFSRPPPSATRRALLSCGDSSILPARLCRRPVIVPRRADRRPRPRPRPSPVCQTTPDRQRGLDPPVGCLATAVKAVGVNLEQYRDPVAKPPGDLHGGNTRVQPELRCCMAKIVRPADQWRGDLLRRQCICTRLPPQGGVVAVLDPAT
jgi:hypothetical protein